MAVFIFSLPFERIGSYPLNAATGYPLIHPAQIVGAALIGAYILKVFAGHERPRHIPAFNFLLLFLLTSIISAARVNISPVWSILAWLFFIVTLFWVVAQLATKERLPTIKWAIIVTVIAVSVFGIYQFFGDLVGLSRALTGIRDRYSKVVLGFPRLQSTALEPLYFANYLFLPIFTLFAVAIQKKNNKNRAVWLTLGTALTAFALTFSRSAAASGVVGLVVLAICLNDQIGKWSMAHLKQIIGVVVVLFVALALIVSVSVRHTKSNQVGGSILRDYFTTKIIKTGSFTERLHDEKLAITIWKQHPVFGVGIGGFGSAYYGCHIGKCVYRPNNQALEVLAEGGVVGFLAFYSFLLALLIYGWRAMKRTTGEQRAMLAGAIAATVAMIVQSQTFSGFLCCLTYTWGTLGLLAGLSVTRKPKTIKGGSQ